MNQCGLFKSVTDIRSSAGRLGLTGECLKKTGLYSLENSHDHSGNFPKQQTQLTSAAVSTGTAQGARKLPQHVISSECNILHILCQNNICASCCEHSVLRGHKEQQPQQCETRQGAL